MYSAYELTSLLLVVLHASAFLLELSLLPTPSVTARFSWILPRLFALPSIPSPHFVASGDANFSLNSV